MSGHLELQIWEVQQLCSSGAPFSGLVPAWSAVGSQEQAEQQWGLRQASLGRVASLSRRLLFLPPSESRNPRGSIPQTPILDTEGKLKIFSYPNPGLPQLYVTPTKILQPLLALLQENELAIELCLH